MPETLACKDRIECVCKNIFQQFHSRTVIEGNKSNTDFRITLDVEQKFDTLWLTFSKDEQRHTVTIPLPYLRNGVALITQNEVERAICNYYLVERGTIIDYISAISLIICGDPTGLIPEHLVKGTPFIQRIINSFQYGNAPTITYNLQRAINEIVNKMPLHETDLNSWVMNHRLIIVDPAFDELRSPAEKLEYQIAKNKRFFHEGWTSIGLSDGVLADRNYILTTDIRKLTPFGIRFHNPGRNLYSTLGMQGDELPIIQSKSMKQLSDKGLSRKGWNLNTLFADVPDVFEDQILVDKRHASKFVTYTRRYQCFGHLLVKEGDRLKKGHKLSINRDGDVKRLDLAAPYIKVKKISEAITNVGGVKTKVYNVVISYRRYFKDGTKLTNLHGNKGVIRLMDLGNMIDPRSGELVPIDVICGAKSVQKRGNFGQILEALTNNITGGKKLTINDDYTADMNAVAKQLEGYGFPPDGTCLCHTYVGELTGICGKVFWGVIGQPEGSLWQDGATTKKNGRELRTAGLKFSTVEMRALETRFGKDNPVLEEVMMYAQGTEDLYEKFNILRSRRGEIPPRKEIVNVTDVKAVNQNAGVIMDEGMIKGTVVDESFFTGGFVLQLPVWCEIRLDEKFQLVSEGMPMGPAMEGQTVYTYDKIYIPHSNLRKCWKHDTGKLGLSEIGALINNIVISSNRLIVRPMDTVNYMLFYNAISAYFRRISMMMGGKRGDVSTYGMSVRYPYSAKAKATLTNALPKNTVEIHRNMARDLNVSNGDIVLVERFPCLGFMSLRPQKVHVTEDPQCRYTIRVSKNSLGSLSLDFDGDDIYLASFHTPEAKALLRKEWTNPNKACYDVIKQLNKKAGIPHTKCLGLQDYNIIPFGDLDAESHAELVKRATGVKSHTGPVIALAYNIMRLMENSDVADSQKANVAIELFLDKVGNSVFKQKHGVQSLHDIVIDAICTANVDVLVEQGFKRSTSTIICNVIVEKAKALGVHDLVKYHEFVKSKGTSNIINRIVRTENMIYFASRAQLEGCNLLRHMEQPEVDIPSKLLYWIMSGKSDGIITPLDEHRQDKALDKLFGTKYKDACRALHTIIDTAFSNKDRFRKDNKLKGFGKLMDKTHLNRSVPKKVNKTKSFGELMDERYLNDRKLEEL
jgi:hypothetical protein